MRDTKGFTLIELLIVVVIIGILAAIAIPRFSATRERAYFAAMKSDLKNLASQQVLRRFLRIHGCRGRSRLRGVGGRERGHHRERRAGLGGHRDAPGVRYHHGRLCHLLRHADLGPDVAGHAGAGRRHRVHAVRASRS